VIGADNPYMMFGEGSKQGMDLINKLPFAMYPSIMDLETIW